MGEIVITNRLKLNGLFISFFILVFAAGCAARLPREAPPPRASTTSTTASTPIQSLLNTPTATAALVYDNPVYDDDFPDPFVLRVGDAYYAYSTNVRSNNVPVLKSANLAQWERVGDAMPLLPKWAASGLGLTWAPSVIQRGDTFVLYFTARDLKSGRQCIGRAVSDQPAGKFTDDSSGPFVCQVDIGGSIDASPFLDDDGKLYLLWKNDGNCCGRFVALWVQPLSDDGLTLLGEPKEVLRYDQRWEIPLIEAPAMLKRDGAYYLFYSGNWYESDDYAVGYAVCQSVTGPCRKPLDKPIFAQAGDVAGPGGQEFFTDRDGDLWMAYHAWDAGSVGYGALGWRSLRIDPITFVDGKPILTGPTIDPQPLN